jgi:hypothetical protein
MSMSSFWESSQAARELSRLETARGFAAWWFLVCGWTAAVATRFGHV